MDVRGDGGGGCVCVYITECLTVAHSFASAETLFIFWKGRKPAASVAPAFSFHSSFAALCLVDVLLWRLTVTQQSSRALISEQQAPSELRRAVQQCVGVGAYA